MLTTRSHTATEPRHTRHPNGTTQPGPGGHPHSACPLPSVSGKTCHSPGGLVCTDSLLLKQYMHKLALHESTGLGCGLQPLRRSPTLHPCHTLMLRQLLNLQRSCLALNLRVHCSQPHLLTHSPPSQLLFPVPSLNVPTVTECPLCARRDAENLPPGSLL